MKHKKLVSNTIMLYLLTFSNYFFSLITVPYQTRILGPEIYGNIGFASAFMIYFSLTLDFGFLLSATADVSKSRDNKAELSKIFSTVSASKILLFIVSTIVFILLGCFVERIKQDIPLFLLYYISSVLSAFLPDYLYRGLEKMHSITIRSVGIRMFFTCMIFLFLKRPDQYYLVPLFSLFGNLGSLIIVFYHVTVKMGIKLTIPCWNDVIFALKKSSAFFYSRVASSIYSATNTFVLGLIYGNLSSTVGYYTAADKLISTAKQGFSPVVDSLYPYMVVRKDYSLIKRILLIAIPAISAGCVIAFIFSYDICELFFGEEFRYAGKYLRCMIPILWCSFPAMLFGFPIMIPLGMEKTANNSNIFGACLQIIQLLFLYMSGTLTALNICMATCITELATMTFRIGAVAIHYYRAKKV